MKKYCASSILNAVDCEYNIIMINVLVIFYIFLALQTLYF